MTKIEDFNFIYHAPHSCTKGENKHRRYTLASHLDRDPETGRLILNVGSAVCGKKDNFVRRRGVTIASGRAKSSSPATSIIFEEEPTLEELRDTCINYAMEVYPEQHKSDIRI